MEVPIYRAILNARSKETPIWEKKCLTIDEASTYFGIGSPKIRELIEEKKCPFVLYMGNKPYIIRVKMEKFLDEQYLI